MIPLVLALSLAAAAPGERAVAARPDTVETPDAVRSRVTGVLAALFHLPESALRPETDLVRDLGADDTDLAEAWLAVYEAFGLAPPSRTGATTVDGLTRQVEAARQGGGALRAPGLDSLTTCTVFYVTDRGADRPGDPSRAYGGDRGTRVQGVCRVTVPASHRAGHLEGPRFPCFARWNAAKHVVLDGVEPLEAQAFYDSLGVSGPAPLDAGASDLLLFVHGFNTTFEKAARRTAQMAYDMAFPGRTIFFSWPSDGNVSRYVADREDAEWSAYDLAAFLETLARRGDGRRLHVIAHSMGNQVLVRALLEVSRRNPRGGEPLVDNVILAAPDLDADLFANRMAPEILHLARRWTLYVSDKDVALDASAILGVRRLGMPLPVVPGVETVDASGVEVTPWNPPEFHDYYATKLKVLADLRAVLSGLPPGGRDLVPREKNGVAYWSLR